MLVKYLLSIASLSAAVLGLEIYTPASLVVCQPTLISWTGGTGPYRLSILPGGRASAPPLKDFGELGAQVTSYTWTVDIPAGTSITFQLVDSTNEVVYTSPVSPRAGSSVACLEATS